MEYVLGSECTVLVCGFSGIFVKVVDGSAVSVVIMLVELYCGFRIISLGRKSEVGVSCTMCRGKGILEEGVMILVDVTV